MYLNMYCIHHFPVILNQCFHINVLITSFNFELMLHQ